MSGGSEMCGSIVSRSICKCGGGCGHLDNEWLTLEQWWTESHVTQLHVTRHSHLHRVTWRLRHMDTGTWKQSVRHWQLHTYWQMVGHSEVDTESLTHRLLHRLLHRLSHRLRLTQFPVLSYRRNDNTWRGVRERDGQIRKSGGSTPT